MLYQTSEQHMDWAPPQSALGEDSLQKTTHKKGSVTGTKEEQKSSI